MRPTDQQPSFRSGIARLAIATALAGIAQRSAHAQETRWSRIGSPGLDQLGRAVCWVEDWDGDGKRDFAAGVPTKDPIVLPRVIVYSTGTGAPLLEIVDGEVGSDFGAWADHNRCGNNHLA